MLKAALLLLGSTTYFTVQASDAVFLNNHALPQAQMWEGMYDNAAAIEAGLNSGDGSYTLVYKSPGGSSQQTLILDREGQTLGIWSAPNHATYLEGEIFAFNLARLLGHSEWSTPATRMFLEGPGKALAETAYNPSSTPKARRCNRDHFNAFAKANDFVPGAFMAFIEGLKPEDVPKLVDRKRKKGFNADHFVVKMVTGQREPSEAPVYLSLSGKESDIVENAPSGDFRVSSELEVTKQLSFLALIDALNSQRDRFGPYGSNMEVMMETDADGFSISLVDNGGISTVFKTSSVHAFIGDYAAPAIKRFESSVYEKVQTLNEFIKSNAEQPLVINGSTFYSLDELREALGIAAIDIPKPNLVAPSCDNYTYLYDWNRMTDTRWTKFKEALPMIAEHMKTQVESGHELLD